MNTRGALYKVHDGPVRIPLARREVSRVVLSPSHVTLELTSPKDPLTSTVDLFAIESIDLGRVARQRRGAGADAGTLEALLERRVTACFATPDGSLDLRIAGLAAVRSTGWNVGLGNGRHWAPHAGGRIAEWRPGEWPLVALPAGRRAVRHDHRLEATTSLPLVGQQVRAISFGDRTLGLLFAVDAEAQPPRAIERLPDVEVEVTGPVALGADRQAVDAEAPRSVAPLLALVGVATTGGTVSPDGTFKIGFADGSVMTAGSGEGNEWVVTIEDRGGWYLAKDGTTTFSEPEEVRPLHEAGRALLVRAYLEYSSTDRPDLHWSFERLSELTRHAPDDAYEVIRELVRHAPSPYVLGIVAAGPLEDLLSDWGERVIDRLETDARADPKLMAACAGVWKLHMPDEVWGRLRGLVGIEADS